MSTWHQRKAGNVGPPPPRDSWTVWSSPPERMASSMSGFSSREEAQAYIDRCEGFRPGSSRYYTIIPPSDTGGQK